MQNIKQHIRKQELKRVYLLYGTEDYLKKYYREQLKKAALSGGSDMNVSRFYGKGIDGAEVLEALQTVPFFAPKRFVLIEDSGLFKGAGNFSELIPRIPETACLVFCEHEVDKRNKLYKAVKAAGYVCEMNGMEEGELKLWIAAYLKKQEKQIREPVAAALVLRTGGDMELLTKEMDKLTAYAGERQEVRMEDVEALCAMQTTSQVFQMIDELAFGRMEKALALYRDLLSLKERPMTIHYLVTRHLNRLYLLKELLTQQRNRREIAQILGIPPFAVSRYCAQADLFSADGLRKMLDFSADLEESVKKGRLFDQIGVELLIVGCQSDN